MNTSTHRYAELHCVSNFSFLRGASHPEELIQQADHCGYQALALTDECSVAGVVRAHQTRKDLQLKTRLIIGSEFRLNASKTTSSPAGRYILLVSNLAAYQELCQLISRCRQQAEKGQYQFYRHDLLTLQHLLLLAQPEDIHHPQEQQLIHHFYHPDNKKNRYWLLAERLLDEHDHQRYEQICHWASQYNLPLVCGNDVHMHTSQRKALQDCLTAIRLNTSLNDCKQHVFANAERHLRSLKKLHYLYPEKLLHNTCDIARRCTFELDEISYNYPRDSVPAGQQAHSYLRRLVEQGQQKRFPGGTPESVQTTINKELKLIRQKNYEHYFLTVYDIVQFARRNHILCQGRGSAANSVVCYCLEITEVNPLEVQLLFERFISSGRDEPPDIDVDFESQRREEVIQYIYRRYGRERAAIAATVITYRRKSAVRDIGKALGLDLLQLEQLIANYGWRYRGENWLDELLDSSREPAHLLQLLKQRVSEILHFPRHLSQHVGGFVISQGALNNLVPIENASMPGRTVIQWDKDDLEALGLMKVDVLSLGMMSAIRRSLDMLSSHEHSMTLSDIPRDDPATYQMLQRADTIGVFQVESRAQMNMLPRLRPNNYYDLVIQVSIVRPGPIHGDMVHPYLKRRRGQEAADYPLAALKPILQRTLGIPLFQEQVIAFAMVAADFSASEADQLRRSMASWRKKGHMQQLQQRLETNLLKNGFQRDYIQRIQHQLEGFGEYGFPESHAASFALLVYVTAWLKCHHPAVFCCALLNSQPMGFYSPAQLLQDARQHGVEILPLDVNHSSWQHQLANNTTDNDHKNPAIRLGLRLVKGLTKEAGQQLQQQRPLSGYSSIADCVQRARLTKPQRQALASANAFGALASNRYQARWQVAEPLQDDLLAPLQQQPDSENESWLPVPSETDNLAEDYHSLGLSLGRHPLEIMRQQGTLGDSVTALGLKHCAHGDEVYVAGLVTCRQRPGTSAGVTFVTLEDETGNINVIVWLATAQRQLKTLVQSRILQVYGKVEKDPDSGVIHLIAYRLLDLSRALPLPPNSRDYH